MRNPSDKWLTILGIGLIISAGYIFLKPPELKNIDNDLALKLIPEKLSADRPDNQPSLLVLATQGKPSRLLLLMLKADFTRQGIELTDEQFEGAYGMLLFAGAKDTGMP